MKDDNTLHLCDRFSPTSYAAWREEVDRWLKGSDFEKRLVKPRADGLRVEPIYTSGHRTEGEIDSAPGFYPYRRGTKPLPGWGTCQRYAEADRSAAVRALESDRDRGTAAFWIRLDRSVRLGLDLREQQLESADGVLCDTPGQLGELLGALDLRQAAVFLDAGCNGLPLMAALMEHARSHDINYADLKGGVCLDPLGALATDGRLPTSLATAWRWAAELVSFSESTLPGMRNLLVSAEPYHMADAGIVLEVALALATGVDCLRTLDGRGIGVETSCSQLMFRLPVGSEIFLEVAKIRAFRQVWARAVRVAGGSDAAARAYLHAVDSTRNQSARDPYVNMLRSTGSCLIGSVAGVDLLTTESFDRPLAATDAFGQRIATNTQSVLREESHLGRVADPAGGSWLIESLTDQIADAAWTAFQQIEAEGGLSRALSAGLVQQRIATVADEVARRVARRKTAIVGVSEFPNIRDKAPDRAAPDLAQLRREGLVNLEQHWTTDDLSIALQVLQIDEPESAALVLRVLRAIDGGATFADLCAALADESEPARLDVTLKSHRRSAAFESLRERAEDYAEQNGRAPTVFMANLGAIPIHKARSTFAQNFFWAGGFSTAQNDGFEEVEPLIAAFRQANAHGAVICSSDLVYAERATAVAAALREQGARFVALAGRPGTHEKSWRSAGVTTFIHLGCDALEVLGNLLESLEVAA